MKKIFMLILVLVIGISLATTAFAQDDESILIYPWLIEPDEYGRRIITVSPNQEIRLGARWGACSVGLALAWAKTSDVAYAIEGQPIFTSMHESRQYWSLPPVPVANTGYPPCMGHSDTGWWVYWEYQLGMLNTGDHLFQFDYWNDHLQTDGGDYDGDGKPDIVKDWARHIDFIIRVIDN